MNLVESLGAHRLLAIVRGKDPAAALNTVRTLAEEGIAAIEVSLTTADALTVIRQARAELGPGALLGAGTVRSAEDAARAVDSRRVVPRHPGTGRRTQGVRRTRADGRPDTDRDRSRPRPGRRRDQTLPRLPRRPRLSEGSARPVPEVPFVPVGGVDAQIARDYLDRGALAVGVGSPLVGDAADGGELEQLRARAAEFRKTATGERP